MSISEELNAELKDAMRAHDRNRMDVIRQINSGIARAVTAPEFKGEAVKTEVKCPQITEVRCPRSPIHLSSHRR